MWVSLISGVTWYPGVQVGKRCYSVRDGCINLLNGNKRSPLRTFVEAV